MAPKLRKGEKHRRENVPIGLNDVQDFYRQVNSDMQNKGATVSLTVQTSHFGIGASNKQSGTSFGKKTAHKLDRIENNPLSLITTLLFVYRELLPSMIDVGPVTAWELFKTMCTGTAVAEFNEILFRSSWDTHSTIDKEFNATIVTGKEEDEVVKEWKQKNLKRETERAGYPVSNYSWKFPPDKIPPPPQRAPKDKLVKWNVSGIQGMDALAWLNLHKHGWEFSELLHDKIMEEVKTLAFRGFGKEAGRIQIDYLTEDLKMDSTHKVSTFLRLLEWFSEAQLLYPKISNDKEVGCLFSESRKKQILWNYAFENFKDEINNMNKTRYSDFNDYAEAKEAFLLAEERKTSKLAEINAKKPKDTNGPHKSHKGNADNKGKGTKGGRSNDHHPGKGNNGTPECSYCGIKGHLGKHCFSNPASTNYKGKDRTQNRNGDATTRKRKSYADMNASEKADRKQQFSEWLESQEDDYASP
jgi:hypothetical protein